MDSSYNEEDYLEMLKKLQESMPNIILPTMGLIDNDTKVDINSSDFFKESKEE